MVEDSGGKDSSSEDIFDEFQSCLEQFPVLRDLIDEIEKGKLEGDYRFRRVEDRNFDGFDLRLKIKMPLQKSIKLRNVPEPEKVYPLEILEKAKEVVVVGVVPARDLDEIFVQVDGKSIYLFTKSGLKKRISVNGVDWSEAPKLAFKNGLLEIRLKKLTRR
jgi:HSP20 family molecular chaperone IbpA